MVKQGSVDMSKEREVRFAWIDHFHVRTEVLDLVGEQTEWIDPLFKIWLVKRYWGSRSTML